MLNRSSVIPFHNRFFFFIFLILFQLFSVITLQAAPYRPSHPLLLETEMQSTDSESAQYKIRQYRVEADTKNATKQSLTFYAETPRKQLLCRFIFHDDNTISWQKTSSGLPQVIPQSIFLDPGFPLPVDILPVASQVENIKTYDIQTSSGGRTFKNSYTVEIMAVSLDAATENGWLRTTPAPDTKLLLFSVTNAQQENISKQLWPIDGDWWLYEETPFRKSWRIDSLR